MQLTSNQPGASYQWLDCNNGNSQIQGQINQSLFAVSNGNYAVAISKNLCIDTSACYELLSVGLENKDKVSDDISLYPNPAGNIIYLDLAAGSEACFIEIMDAEGRLVMHQKIAPDQKVVDIDVSNFKKGIYLCKILESQNYTSVKFAVAR